MIEQFDYFLRIMTIGSALTLIAMFVASEVRAAIRVPLIGMLVGVIGYLLNTGPLLITNPLIKPWVDIVALSTPFWIWLFGRRLFEREPERRLALGAAAAMVLGWFLQNFLADLTWRTGFLILHVVALVLVADLVRVGIFEREDDLVEDRRLVRLWLPLLVAVQAGQILFVELLELISTVDSRHPMVSLFNSTTILIIILFAGLILFRTNRDLLPRQGEEQAANPLEEIVPELDLNPQEKVLHDKLTAAMEKGAYTAPGLTITALADQLDTPEHRLRALINSQLGHRNFSAFLNGYRVAEAQRMLSSPEKVDLPVLTIAMDLGYNSLAPFNRSFRELTGSSPSEYRKRAFVQEPEAEAAIEADQN